MPSVRVCRGCWCEAALFDWAVLSRMASFETSDQHLCRKRPAPVRTRFLAAVRTELHSGMQTCRALPRRLASGSPIFRSTCHPDHMFQASRYPQLWRDPPVRSFALSGNRNASAIPDLMFLAEVRTRPLSWLLPACRCRPVPGLSVVDSFVDMTKTQIDGVCSNAWLCFR